MGFHQKFPYSTPIFSGSQPHFSADFFYPLPKCQNREHALDIHTTLRDFLSVERRSSLVKNFAIAGFILAEIYMFFAVASPRLRGVEIPLDALAVRLFASSLLFGPFGLAMGTGLGLLADGLRRSFLRAREKKKDRIV
jgi:hypothetical protein